MLANCFLYQCLRSRNFHAEADGLLTAVKKLIHKSGFREYYHPFSGEGYGAKQFTWSGLVVDMMSMQAAHQGER